MSFCKIISLSKMSFNSGFTFHLHTYCSFEITFGNDLFCDVKLEVKQFSGLQVDVHPEQVIC